jgi:uncharacterized membrane protein
MDPFTADQFKSSLNCRADFMMVLHKENIINFLTNIKKVINLLINISLQIVSTTGGYMNQVLKLSGRILLGGVIAVFGIFHIMNGAGMAGLVPKFMPFPVFWVYLTGVFHILFAIFIIGNLRYSKWISIGMAALCVFYALAIQLPGMLNSTGMQQMTYMIGMLKDIGLAGGAFFIAAELKK